MWENERRKTIIRNIIIFLLLALAVFGLAKAMIAVNQQIEAEDGRLMEENANQRQELNDARQENLEAIRLAYQKDLDTVAQYLPGIVCWGDSLTTGSSGNVSYPYTLQKYINTYLCDIYDFRSSIENAEEYARLDWNDYQVSVPVVNMGSGQEDCATILGRAGVVPYVVRTDFVIPAEPQPVAISIVSENGKPVSPLTAGNAGVNPVTIAGVQGTITRASNNQGGMYSYQFTRLEAGEETPVAKGTEIVTASKEEYRDYIHVVWLGTYGEYLSAEKLVSDTKALLQRQTGNTDRYLVIGPCTIRGAWTSSTTTAMDAIDSAMLQAFGSHYINVRKYLIEDGLRDAGISPTKADTQSIARGNVPDSFRSNTGGADMTAAAYKLIGKLVFERMDRLGFFDEVRAELNLDKTTQDILKNDPTYFERLLKAS